MNKTKSKKKKDSELALLKRILTESIRRYIDKYNILSEAKKTFGVDVQKTTINAIRMATKEVIYRKGKVKEFFSIRR